MLRIYITVGGIGQDVELDEVSFRSVSRKCGIVWLRCLAVVRPGSSLVWSHKVPYRITLLVRAAAIQFPKAKMRTAFFINSDEPVLGFG